MNPRIRHEGHEGSQMEVSGPVKERDGHRPWISDPNAVGGRSGGRLCQHARSLFMRKTLKMITVITVAPKLSQKAPLKHIVLKNCICSLLICTKNNH